MVTIIDLNTELARLTKLEGRRPTTTAAERQDAIARLAPYRDGAIFIAKFAGKGAWERHPKGEEIVQILDGATTLHLITEEGRQTMQLETGTVVVVPQGAWHQFDAPDGIVLMTTTPQPTENLEIDIDDPRIMG